MSSSAPPLRSKPWSRRYAISIGPDTPYHRLPSFLSVLEFCRYTQIAKNTTYNGIRDGTIEPKRFSARKLLIPRSAVADKAQLREELVKAMAVTEFVTEPVAEESLP